MQNNSEYQKLLYTIYIKKNLRIKPVINQSNISIVSDQFLFNSNWTCNNIRCRHATHYSCLNRRFVRQVSCKVFLLDFSISSILRLVKIHCNSTTAYIFFYQITTLQLVVQRFFYSVVSFIFCLTDYSDKLKPPYI